jgi:hypothetical protein
VSDPENGLRSLITANVRGSGGWAFTEENFLRAIAARDAAEREYEQSIRRCAAVNPHCPHEEYTWFGLIRVCPPGPEVQ